MFERTTKPLSLVAIPGDDKTTVCNFEYIVQAQSKTQETYQISLRFSWISIYQSQPFSGGAAYEGLQSQGWGDIVNLISYAWAGSQRFGTLVWSGNVPSPWKTFRAQLRSKPTIWQEALLL